MKGLVFDKPQSPLRLAEDLEKPTPGSDQILVKSVAVAINPLDHLMLASGLLVVDWPCVIGCDVGGIVEEVGSAVKNFQVGDKVCGCSRIGIKGYATFQEYLLMDSRLTVKVPPSISLEQACTIGAGSYTASLGLAHGMNVEYPATPAQTRDEWIVVLGGASAVGQFAVQLAKISGYKVLASCSPKTKDVPLSAGADATFSYREPEEAQLNAIKEATGGNFARIFDAVAQNHEFAFKAIGQLSTAGGEKYFTSTDDWTEMTYPDGVNVDRIHLGLIGREGEAAQLVNNAIAAIVPNLHEYLKSGALKPMKYDLVGPVGFDGVLNALEKQKAGQAGGSKIIARIAA